MVTGVKTDLIIDTCNAGAGNLAVNMDGPSRVAMDCTEVEEGYKVSRIILINFIIPSRNSKTGESIPYGSSLGTKE
jgi:hypothetical protein